MFRNCRSKHSNIVLSSVQETLTLIYLKKSKILAIHESVVEIREIARKLNRSRIVVINVLKILINMGKMEKHISMLNPQYSEKF